MLEINSILKIFEPGTPNEKIALDNLSLSLEAGEFVSILGSNGAGKSTLFNAVSGKFPLDKGRIVLDGKDITYMKDYKRALDIGRIQQDPLSGTAPNMTIEENLSMAYTRKAKKSFFAVNKNDRKIFSELLAPLGLGLENRLTTKMGQLSGGQRQAVSLMMATIAEPKLLLLDEHVAALDPVTAQKVMDITKQIVAERKLTTLMITHDIDIALRYGNRTVMMDEGQIILDISGQLRSEMTIDSLVKMYAQKSHKQLSTDRVLLH